MSEFQTATENFLKWFKSVGGEFRDDLLEITDLRSRGAGRGILAIKDIPQECTLFTIPRDAIINVETSELPKKLPKVFDPPIAEEDDDDDDEDDEDNEPLDPWGSLILVMLYEYLQGDASRWKPYFDILPTTFDTPIFWTEAELQELKGTCLTSEKIGKKESDDMLRTRIIPVVLENASVFYAEGAPQLSEEELLTLAHRIGSTIMAYAFDLDNKEEQSDDEEDGWVEDHDGQTMLGMVPMADVLNANADFNAHVNHGESLEVLGLRSDVKPGTEILNYYGPLPSSELLRRYGYVTPEHRRYDVVEIPWKLVQSALAAQLSLSDSDLSKAESQLDEDELEEFFIVERDSGAPDEEGRLTEEAVLREVSPELEEQLKALLKALKKSKPELADKRKRDETFNSVVAKALADKMAEYPTTREEDEALLRKSDLASRHRMAVEVRLGEKILLQEAIELVKAAAAPKVEEAAERPAKRTKTKA